MRCISLITIFLIVVGSACSQSRISGTILDENTGKPLKATKIILYQMDSVEISPIDINDSILILLSETKDLFRRDTIYTEIKNTKSNAAGQYQFDNLTEGIYKVTAFHRTKKQKGHPSKGEFSWIRNIKLNRQTGVMIPFTLHVNCEFDKTRHKKYCPSCLKKDQVKPIKWGFSVDDLIGQPDPKYFYNGFCVRPRCHPIRHCLRCDLDF